MFKRVSKSTPLVVMVLLGGLSLAHDVMSDVTGTIPVSGVVYSLNNGRVSNSASPGTTSSDVLVSSVNIINKGKSRDYLVRFCTNGDMVGTDGSSGSAEIAAQLDGVEISHQQFFTFPDDKAFEPVCFDWVATNVKKGTHTVSIHSVVHSAGYSTSNLSVNLDSATLTVW
ncbi:MAG: hypothetical protein WCL60_10495 [Methylococcales bacterium]